jgi:hypothetical protein
VHPEPEHQQIGVRAGGSVHFIGYADSSAYIRDIRAGRETIDSMIRQGLFARGSALVFDNVAHATDVDAWLSYRAEATSRTVLDPGIVQQARDLLSEADGEILISGRGYAARLERPQASV